MVPKSNRDQYMEAQRDRLVFSASCRLHGSAGFTNLSVERGAHGGIRINPHVDGSCVLAVGPDEVHFLVEHLKTWLAEAGSKIRE